MPLDRDNSPESFLQCGFTLQHAEHLSRLSNQRDGMINKKQAPCSRDMFLYYQQRASELSDEIEDYWQKYQNKNSDRYE
ncbi:MAG: DUF413 domain-containing protein [Sulfurimonas sp.]|nr:DUF413 domain-containing protein [Sulfurimonas sp.]